jgi:glycosyltransferase involved in cell wall biosynthesis
MTEVSVGICAMNEEETIGDLIEQIVAEDVDLQEIVVVAGGTDSTLEIVEEKSDEYGEIELVRETERRGQALAQNEILSRTTGDAIFLIDGDGTIKEGSMEKMMEVYDGKCILHGRETPITDQSFRGKMVSLLWDIHHETCLEEPKFSTQLGLMPADLVDRFPEVVLDDTYVQLEAEKKSYRTVYIPDAVKYHNTSQDIRYYLVQREKNKSGIYQLRKMGYRPPSRAKLNLKTYLDEMINQFPRISAFLGILVLEIVAMAYAQMRRIADSFPNKWSRPGEMS